MKNKNIGPLKKAKDYAFLLLKFRSRSEKEVYLRLKKNGFDTETIQATLSYLKDNNFINDISFANAWIESRLKKQIGLNRIRKELKIKGIDEKIIEEKIDELKDRYLEQDVVKKIAEEKFNRLKKLDPDKAKRRVFLYLMRRGFSADKVLDTLSELR